MKQLRKLFLGLMVMVAATVSAQDYAYLTISEAGSNTSYEVSKISKITFDESNMILHLSDNTTQQLPLATLQKMSFNAEAAGISNLSVSTSKLSMQDGTLRVSGEKPSRLFIYNTGGAIVKSLPLGPGQTEVSLTGMNKGVYIVKIGSESKKIMNK